jgi:hypothetical protein
MNQKEKRRLERREKLYKKQRKERGWDDSETWALYHPISKFVLPRIKRFREVTCGYPGYLGSMEEWYAILDHIIFAMEICSDEDKYYGCHSLTKKDWERVYRGCRLLGKHFQDLWW